MAGTSYFGDLVGTLFDRPRMLWRGARTGSLEQRCADLLKERTEVASLQIASEILARFAAMDLDERISFFKHINKNLDVDASTIAATAAAYANDRSAENYRALARVCGVE